MTTLGTALDLTATELSVEAFLPADDYHRRGATVAGMSSASYAMPLRVRYVECDMQGRVFNAHYLTWVDMAHTEALRDVAGGYAAMTDAGIDVVVAAAELSFRRPATFDDELVIEVRLAEPGNTSLRSEFTILRGDELIAECVMTHVCVDAETYLKTPWPDWFRRQLAERA